MMDAIPALTSLLVGPEGPHCRLGVWHNKPIIMVSPSAEAPTVEATWAWYPSNPYCPTRAMAMPAGVALASTATIVPLRVASAGSPWNQIPGSG